MTDRPVFMIPTLQNFLIIQIDSPYEIDFRLGKNMWFHLDDGVYKGKTRGRRGIHLLLINSLEVSAPAFGKNDATILFTTLILLHILHMYVSSRSTNVNSCTKSRRE